METSYHFTHQNTESICRFGIFSEVLHEVATLATVYVMWNVIIRNIYNY